MCGQFASLPPDIPVASYKQKKRPIADFVILACYDLRRKFFQTGA